MQDSPYEKFMNDTYDVLILGCGVVGAATAYLAAEYTDAKKIGVLDKEPGIARRASHKKANSQTLHEGKVELNYSREKTKEMRLATKMVLGYARHSGAGYDFMRECDMMVLAVGDDIPYLYSKYDSLKPIFPDLVELDKREEIEKYEPFVVKGRAKDEEIAAISSKGYIMDFGGLSRSFIDSAVKSRGKEVELRLNQEARKIEKTLDGYKVYTQTDTFSSRFLVISAGSYTLSLLKQIGIGGGYSILPIEGRFFYTRDVVKGKVYMVQREGIPFASVHADRDWDGFTRLGPTASFALMLEKGRLDIKKVKDYAYGNLNGSLLRCVANPEKGMRNMMLKNTIYNLPKLGKFFFWKNEARKIIPSLKCEDLKPAKDFGEVRPTLVDKTGKVVLGEMSLTGDNTVGNITPSPGASGCLHIAYQNLTKLVEALDLKFYSDEFRKIFRDLRF